MRRKEQVTNRPAGATALAVFFVGYGAVALLSFLIALFRAEPDFPLLDAGLASMVAVLAIVTGVNLWRLSPATRTSLLAWAAGLTVFNLVLFQGFEGSARWGMAIGLPGALLLVWLLDRYIKRVCVRRITSGCS